MKIFTPNTIISSTDVNANFAEHAMGSGANYLWIAGTLMQWGSGVFTVPAGAGLTVTFPIAFDTTPSVTGNVLDTNPWVVWFTVVSATRFVGKQSYTGAGLTCNWMATGRKAVKP